MQPRDRMRHRGKGDDCHDGGSSESDGGASRWRRDAAHKRLEREPGDARGHNDRHEKHSDLSTRDARGVRAEWPVDEHRPRLERQHRRDPTEDADGRCSRSAQAVATQSNERRNRNETHDRAAP